MIHTMNCGGKNGVVVVIRVVVLIVIFIFIFDVVTRLDLFELKKIYIYLHHGCVVNCGVYSGVPFTNRLVAVEIIPVQTELQETENLMVVPRLPVMGHALH
eukprot:gb/GECH01006570.1/.p1 GENE.gb/GECH01006570.1/~~gb/GECH01006570.1/.p1  ORF type:complete len:101 (+),score=13.63 gb/GECH01006570.1/:1-303(+)